jgi:AcrR family transcriptional regulator
MEVEPHPATVRSSARRGRQPQLSRARIADAALAVGFEDLTLVAVAERLGVTHAALYTHVVDRDDLVIAAVDQLVDSLPSPKDGPDWREVLEAEAWTIWDACAGHPGMLAAIDATGRFPASLMRRFAEVCRRLVDHGFAADRAVLAADTVYDLAADSSSRGGHLERLSAAERAAMAADWTAPLDGEVAEVLAGAITGPIRAWFARKLGLVLDGIAAGGLDGAG